MIRRVLAIIVFLTLFSLTMGGGHYYLIERLALDPEWPLWLSNGIIALFIFGIVNLIVQVVLRHRFGAATTGLSWIAYTWLGVLFIFIILTAASDGIVWGIARLQPAPWPADPVALARIQALAVAGLGIAAAGYALHQGLQHPSIRRVEIALERWPESLDSFRIVQISDVHIGPLLDRRFAEEVTRRVNALEPDLVAVTGDLVDGSAHRIADEVKPFENIRARHGVYFVTGNHDFFSGADDWVEVVRSYGWRPLRNEHVTIRSGDAAFHLAGVDDRQGAMIDGGPGEDMERALADRDPDHPVVLLAHDPGSFKRALKHKIDLQLSGHTHGGQIWPFHWAVRAVIPWVRGLHRVEESHLYVSCGTGFWGPPMRLGAPAEITELVLRRRV
jgi:predicted MPP superfamily phosphohydrolase